MTIERKTRLSECMRPLNAHTPLEIKDHAYTGIIIIQTKWVDADYTICKLNFKNGLMEIVKAFTWGGYTIFDAGNGVRLHAEEPIDTHATKLARIFFGSGKLIRVKNKSDFEREFGAAEVYEVHEGGFRFRIFDETAL